MNTPSDILNAIWSNSGITGNTWTPVIKNIGKPSQRFIEGKPHTTKSHIHIQIDSSVDSYFTPAVSMGGRKALDFGDQKVLWVDCDHGYDKTALKKLNPTYMWETSPGNRQAVWLLDHSVSPAEFSRDGVMGLLAEVLKADRSGVDIGQLLRIPGSYHHKKEEFQGRIFKTSGKTTNVSSLLKGIATCVGVPPSLAAELSREEPLGDRSKVLWKLERTLAERGVAKTVAFKLIKACAWNKWKDDPDRLRADIDKAYDSPSTLTKVEKPSSEKDTEEEVYQPSARKLLTAVDLEGKTIPPVRWMIPKVLPHGSCGLIIASPKVGKTRLAIEMITGLATGDTPLGVKIQKPYPSLLMSLEDGKPLTVSRISSSLNVHKSRHVYHWNGYVDADLIWNPPEHLELYMDFNPLNLENALSSYDLQATIEEYDLQLVVIDTLSMAIGKANVNDAKDMYELLMRVKTISRNTGCSILFIHHTRKAPGKEKEKIHNRVLGSTALHAWSDVVISLDTYGDDGLISMDVQTKSGNFEYFLNENLDIFRPHSEDEN